MNKSFVPIAPSSVATNRVQTKRLLIEMFSHEDFYFFKEIASDQLVKKFFKEWKNTMDCVYFWEREIMSQTADNLYLVIRTQEYIPIGFINLFYMANNCWVVEYAIIETYRNNNYMTEVLEYIYKNPSSFLKTFNSNRECTQLWFDLRENNPASERVLKKISKKFHSNIRMDGIYKILTIN